MVFFKNISVNLNAIERKIIELILNDHALTAEKHQLKLIKQKELLKDIWKHYKKKISRKKMVR